MAGDQYIVRPASYAGLSAPGPRENNLCKVEVGQAEAVVVS